MHKRDIPRIVREFMEQNVVQGGRILVGSVGWAYLIEVFKKTYQMQEVDKKFAMTNDFLLIPHQPSRQKVRTESSAKRLEIADKMIREISNIGMIKGILRSHIPEKGELSICNHQNDGGGTESSHIIQIQGDYVGWSSLVGYPCENDYHTVQLFQT